MSSAVCTVGRKHWILGGATRDYSNFANIIGIAAIPDTAGQSGLFGIAAVFGIIWNYLGLFGIIWSIFGIILWII